MVDIRIIRLTQETRKIFIRFEEDPSLMDIESFYKELQEMNPKVIREPEEFVGM